MMKLRAKSSEVLMQIPHCVLVKGRGCLGVYLGLCLVDRLVYRDA
jgi:hypothetical protein